MNQSKSTGAQHKQSGNPATGADAKASIRKDDKSSHGVKSRVRAGSTEGAGGGA